MKRFNEVNEGYVGSEDVDIIRVAESATGDLMALVKLKEEEQYQLSITFANGPDIFDTFFSFEMANGMFEHILNIEEIEQ
jgi:hypothetical protein